MAPAGNFLHLLSIDVHSASNSLRAVLDLGAGDVEHWLERAGVAGAPLAIVCGPDSVDLYSSEAGRRAAFRPLLESLWSQGRNLSGFEHVRTRVAEGPAAVRHLLRQAAGLASTEHGVSYAKAIHAACQQARRFSTLSEDLALVFGLALRTAERSERETELSAPNSNRALRQVEALGAERIVEEQLVAFQLTAENESPSRAPRPRSSLPPYSSEEPGSCVRLRIAPFSLAPLSERKIG
jgi:hypothetical protein